MEKSSEWFSEWFDSPYYHILYQQRDFQEAERFVANLVDHLNFDPTDKLLDLACGKGRHSIFLNKKGFDVTGVDLSPESIRSANQFANEKLRFSVHDMREVFQKAQFDVILNLFTSFGYFDDEEDNFKAISAVAEGLVNKGTFVLDFMNTPHIIDTLVESEVQELSGIEFHIHRNVVDGFIVKDIRFRDNGKDYHFTEKVKALTYSQFEKYFNFAGLKIKEVFGDYSLNAYNPEEAERMIFITQKN